MHPLLALHPAAHTVQLAAMQLEVRGSVVCCLMALWASGTQRRILHDIS